MFIFIGSFFCILLGFIFIVDDAGIELLGMNEPPYAWKYITAGIFCFLISLMNLTSGLFFLNRKKYYVPIISSIGMIVAGLLELILFGDWTMYISPIILFSGITLLICLVYLKIVSQIENPIKRGWYN
jgi:glucose uptake protein GlcU